MSQEILYTSAPAGLKPGSRGFSTVVATRGMSRALMDQLEELSAYRHLFLSGPEAARNPVVYSHVRVSVAGRAAHVVSRIADAGLDYTRRTNKLAHHVALDAGELPAGGPAWLLARPGWMAAGFSGPPHERPAGPVVPAGDVAPAPCRAWQRAAGDAGWAGTVAGELLADSRRPIVCVYRLGTDMLALVAEVLALLPAERRWSVTFSTYFTKLAPTTDCRWRSFVEGTPEAEAALRGSGGLVLDLRKPLGRPDDSPAVAAARAGKRLAPPEAGSPGAAPGEFELGAAYRAAAERKAREARQTPAAAEPQSAATIVEPIWEAEPAGVLPGALLLPPPLPPAPAAASSFGLIVGSVVVLLILGAAGFGIWWTTRQPTAFPGPEAPHLGAVEAAPSPTAEPVEITPGPRSPPPAGTSTTGNSSGTGARNPFETRPEDGPPLRTVIVPPSGADGDREAPPGVAMATGTAARPPVPTQVPPPVPVSPLPAGPGDSRPTNPGGAGPERALTIPAAIYVGKISTGEAEFRLPKPWGVDAAWTWRFVSPLPLPKGAKATPRQMSSPLVMEIGGTLLASQSMASFVADLPASDAGGAAVLRYKPTQRLKDARELLEVLPYSALVLTSPVGDVRTVAFWDVQRKPAGTLRKFVAGRDDDPEKTFDVPLNLAGEIRLDDVVIEGVGATCEVVSREPWQILVRTGGGAVTVQVAALPVAASSQPGSRRIALVCGVADEAVRAEFPELAKAHFSLAAFAGELRRIAAEHPKRRSEIDNRRIELVNVQKAGAFDRVKNVEAQIVELEKQLRNLERKLQASLQLSRMLSDRNLLDCRIRARVTIRLDDRTLNVAEF